MRKQKATNLNIEIKMKILTKPLGSCLGGVTLARAGGLEYKKKVNE